MICKVTSVPSWRKHYFSASCTRTKEMDSYIHTQIWLMHVYRVIKDRYLLRLQDGSTNYFADRKGLLLKYLIIWKFLQ